MNNKNNNSNNKTTTLKTLLMLSVVTMMMLVPGGIIIPVHAALGDQLLTINNPTPERDDRFGRSVASTNTGDILVGTPNDNTGATNAGSVYLLDGTTGNLKLTINNPTPAVSDRFGTSVASTNTGDILVGAHGDDTGAMYAGSVYLFDGTTGNLKLTINNPTPERDDFFGRSVATTSTGDLLVGAPRDDTGAPDAGSAYLFDGTTGNLLLTINNPAPDELDEFGVSVASTNTGDILVGAYSDDTGATDAGSVYLFDGTTGSLKLTINNPTPEKGDRFGTSVASTNTGDILIGADLADGYNGVVYLFDGTAGNLLLTINNPSPTGWDQFGFSVASTNTGDILVGAYSR